MNFYIYQNWQAQDNSYTIHKWNCGFCHCGFGMRIQQDIEQGENGVWIGPFRELEYAKNYLLNLGIDPDANSHTCVN